MTKLMLVCNHRISIDRQAKFAWAQAAISEPGAYAFYHPMATCCTLDPASMARAPNPTEQLASAIRWRVGRPARGHMRGPDQ